MPFIRTARLLVWLVLVPAVTLDAGWRLTRSVANRAAPALAERERERVETKRRAAIEARDSARRALDARIAEDHQPDDSIFSSMRQRDHLAARNIVLCKTGVSVQFPENPSLARFMPFFGDRTFHLRLHFWKPPKLQRAQG